MSRAGAVGRPTASEAEKRMAFADAALALAGHEVTDPVLRGILWGAARHELTGDETREAVRHHVLD